MNSRLAKEMINAVPAERELFEEEWAKLSVPQKTRVNKEIAAFSDVEMLDVFEVILYGEAVEWLNKRKIPNKVAWILYNS